MNEEGRLWFGLAKEFVALYAVDVARQQEEWAAMQVELEVRKKALATLGNLVGLDDDVQVVDLTDLIKPQEGDCDEDHSS
jgi:hypothetical protein